MWKNWNVIDFKKALEGTRLNWEVNAPNQNSQTAAILLTDFEVFFDSWNLERDIASIWKGLRIELD